MNFFSHVVRNWSMELLGLSHGFSNDIAARDVSKDGCTMAPSATKPDRW
jgi:hypothetical protein